MKKLFAAINRSLTGKLIIAMALFIVIGSVVLWLTMVHKQERDLMAGAYNMVSSFSEVTLKSLRHDMLTDRTDDIRKVLQSLATTDYIERVRIIDSRGKIFASSVQGELGRSVDRTWPACASCHSKEWKEGTSLVHQRQWTVYRDSNGSRNLTLLEPIRNEPDCFTASCHVHPESQQVIGVMLSDYSLAPIDARISEQILQVSLSLFLVVMFIGVVVSLILWKIVIKPVSNLDDGMRAVSSGDLAHKVEVSSFDEIGRLANTFNAMTDELAAARHRMESWTQTLEEEVTKKTRQIRETQERLIQAEKHAALGRLTADIAHEIRNPLTAVGGFGRRLIKLASTDQQKRYAELIASEADRLEHILKDVLLFSWEPQLHFEEMSLAEIVEETVALFTETCGELGIRLESEITCQLPVIVEKEHVKQAIINLVANAMDALPDGGTILIRVTKEQANAIDYVAIHIIDSGPGVPEESLIHIFEPFYTTKKVGKGTGLGLSISRKIIAEHGGFLRVCNREGGGFMACLFFPYQTVEDRQGVPCWQYMKCGRESDHSVTCPAYPYFGRCCWAVAGTLCAGRVQGTFAQKIADCKQCSFFQSLRGDGELPETACAGAISTLKEKGRI